MVMPPPKMPAEAGEAVVVPPKVNPDELAVVPVAEPNTELVVVVVVVVVEELPKTDPDEEVVAIPNMDPNPLAAAPPPKMDPPDCVVATVAGDPPNTDPLALVVVDADPVPKILFN